MAVRGRGVDALDAVHCYGCLAQDGVLGCGEEGCTVPEGVCDEGEVAHGCELWYWGVFEDARGKAALVRSSVILEWVVELV
jgi:hypothetical protein